MELLFQDRKDAGRKLAAYLESYKKHKDTVVLGLARGGVVVAFEAAAQLMLPCDVIIVKKIGAPGNEELALGAVTDTGETIWNEDYLRMLSISKTMLERQRDAQLSAARQRGEKYRGARAPLDLSNKTVVLIDDGIATGASMQAAIMAIKERGAREVVAAAPVASSTALERLRHAADKVICPYAPEDFMAVGMFYADFSQVTDSEVIQLLSR